MFFINGSIIFLDRLQFCRYTIRRWHNCYQIGDEQLIENKEVMIPQCTEDAQNIFTKA